MPLPEGGKTAWPPRDLKPVFDKLAIWSAWYSGDPEELSAIYGGQTDNVLNHPSQYRGGIVGRVARMWWGTPTPAGEQRTKLHMPLAGDIATKSSDLLFSEAPKITVTDTVTQDHLNESIDEGLHATLLDAGDIGAGLGGVYLRIVWDRDMSPRSWIAPVHADAAVPEWRWGRLTAVTFWRTLERSEDHVLRHLERHEPGSILHGLYDGTSDELGRPVDLTEHPETAPLAALLDEEGQRIITGTDRLTAVYVPNMRPARCWRGIAGAAAMGRSDYSGVEGPLDQLDETWSSLMRDMRLGKGRIIVPDAYLESRGPGRGASWDPEREVYSTLNMLPSGDTPHITDVQLQIRVDEHLRIAQELTAEIQSSAGYSQQSFGDASDVAVTATEVAAKERQSFVTRNRKILYWRPPLAEITLTQLLVDVFVFKAKIEPERPTIEFADSVSEDPEAVARTLQLLHAAEAVSIRTRVERANPDWPKEQVDEEVQRIREESGMGIVVNDPPPDPALNNLAATGNLDGAAEESEVDSEE